MAKIQSNDRFGINLYPRCSSKCSAAAISDASIITTMIKHLLCHQDTSANIDRKSVINHILRNFLYGVDTVHVTISRIVDQNIDLSISFKDFRLLSYDCYYQLSGTAVIAELAEIDALPSSQV